MNDLRDYDCIDKVVHVVRTINPKKLDSDNLIFKKFGFIAENDELDGYHVFDNKDKLWEYLTRHGVKEEIQPTKLGFCRILHSGTYLDFEVIRVELNNVEEEHCLKKETKDNA